MCDVESFPEDPQDPCDSHLTEDACLAAGCTAFLPVIWLSHEDCACEVVGPGNVCVKTANGELLGGLMPRTWYRVVEGAVQLAEFDFEPLPVPIGWQVCSGSDDETEQPAGCVCEAHP